MTEKEVVNIIRAVLSTLEVTHKDFEKIQRHPLLEPFVEQLGEARMVFDVEASPVEPLQMVEQVTRVVPPPDQEDLLFQQLLESSTFSHATSRKNMYTLLSELQDHGPIRSLERRHRLPGISKHCFKNVNSIAARLGFIKKYGGGGPNKTYEITRKGDAFLGLLQDKL